MFPHFELFGVRFNTFPFVLLIAFFVSASFYVLSKKYSKLHMVEFFKACLPLLIGAAIFARILSALTLIGNSKYSFWYNLLYGGSVFYGGIMGGFVGLFLFCRAKKHSFLDYADVFVTIIPIGHAIGRFGCYLNGCCYGKEYRGLFAVDYIVDSISTKVFPTWFIEMLFCAIIFVWFQFICKTRRRGFYTGSYLTAYSVYRFFIEFMRGDEIRGIYGHLSTSQWISLGVFVLGICTLIICYKNDYNNYLLKER